MNGHLLDQKLAELLARNVTNYCIPKKQIAEALDASNLARSTEKLSRLQKEASDLFVESSTSGEAGELLLYLLTERLLGAPQIISKMRLKTASNVHYHGADGVHAKQTQDGLTLFWGESKIYSNRATAVRDCLKSVAPFLTDPDRGAAARDLALVRDNLDVEEKALKDELVRYFIMENPEWNRLKFHASCLVGFDLEEYPQFKDEEEISGSHKIFEEIKKWARHLKKHVSDNNLQEFEIDFFMVPFTDVDAFRIRVLRELGIPTA